MQEYFAKFIMGLIEDPATVPVELGMILEQSIKSRNGLSKTLELIEDGCDPEKVVKLLTKELVQLEYNNSVLSTVLLIYVMSDSFTSDACKASMKMGGDTEEILRQMVKNKFK